MKTALLISCEHAGNQIPTALPKSLQKSFGVIPTILASHRGYDPGAKELALHLGKVLKAQPFLYPYTRLIIESNRSLSHKELFSEYSRFLPIEVKNALIEQYHQAYWQKIKNSIKQLMTRNERVYHVSVHTFTPALKGEERWADIGFLFDPEREEELKWAQRWQKEVEKRIKPLKTAFNYPYLGVDDGLVHSLRLYYSDEKYIGLELELNQKHIANENTIELYSHIALSLKASLHL